MLCPVCRSGDTRVIDSRDDESAVPRRREWQPFKRVPAGYGKVAVLDERVPLPQGRVVYSEPFRH